MAGFNNPIVAVSSLDLGRRLHGRSVRHYYNDAIVPRAQSQSVIGETVSKSNSRCYKHRLFLFHQK